MSQAELIPVRISRAPSRMGEYHATSRPWDIGGSLVIALPPCLQAVLKREALRTGRSAEGLMREAIVRYLKALPPVLLD